MTGPQLFIEVFVLYALLRLAAVAGQTNNIVLLFIAVGAAYIWFVVHRTNRDYQKRNGD